jgi:hypothetical protein
VDPLIGIGAIGGQLRLTRRQARVLLWSSLVTGWLFFLPSAFGPMAGVRGLAFGGGPFGGDVTLDNVIRLRLAADDRRAPDAAAPLLGRAATAPRAAVTVVRSPARALFAPATAAR